MTKPIKGLYQIHVYLNKKELEYLDFYCDKEDRSRNNMIRIMLKPVTKPRLNKGE